MQQESLLATVSAEEHSGWIDDGCAAPVLALKVKVEGRAKGGEVVRGEARGMLDSGAEVSTVAPAVVQALGLVTEKGQPRTLGSYFGRAVRDEYVTVELETGELRSVCRMLVAQPPGGFELALGQRWLAEHGVWTDHWSRRAWAKTGEGASRLILDDGRMEELRRGENRTSKTSEVVEVGEEEAPEEAESAHEPEDEPESAGDEERLTGHRGRSVPSREKVPAAPMAGGAGKRTSRSDLRRGARVVAAPGKSGEPGNGSANSTGQENPSHGPREVAAARGPHKVAVGEQKRGPGVVAAAQGGPKEVAARERSSEPRVGGERGAGGESREKEELEEGVSSADELEEWLRAGAVEVMCCIETEQRETVMGAVHLSDEERSRREKLAQEIMEEFADVFARELNGPAPARATEYKEQLLGDPQRLEHLPPIRQSEEQVKAVQEIISGMLRSGLISQYLGPARCRVFVVKKKTPPGEKQRWRLVLDARPVNKLTQKLPYTGPSVRDALGVLCGWSVLCQADMVTAFYQMAVPPGMREVFSFAGPDGRRYCCNVAVMGATNSMTALANTVADAYADLIVQKKFSPFADDWCWGARGLEGAAAVTREVLQRAREHKFLLHPDKIKLFQDEVTFLGFRVGGGKVRVLADRVEALRAYQRPANKSELRTFLGGVQYYSHLVPECGLLAAPLHRLTGKGAFIWNEEAERAFVALKDGLAAAVEARLPDLDADRPFAIRTDASTRGIGGVLEQQQEDGSWQPVALWSRPTTDAEKRFHIREIELLAVVEMLVRFSAWLLRGRQRVVVWTDHKGLIFLGTTARVSNRAARWVDVLQQFDLEWRFVDGVENVVPDALSRDPAFPADDGKGAARAFRGYFARALLAARRGVGVGAGDGEEEGGERRLHAPAHLQDGDDYPLSVLASLQEAAAQGTAGEAVEVATGDTDESVSVLPSRELAKLVRDGYASDVYFGAILKQLKRGERVEGFYAVGGLLYKDSLEEGPQLCVPDGEALNTVLKGAHDGNCHPGVGKTAGALKGYYFPRARRRIADYVAGCGTCLRSKPEQRRPTGQVIPLPTPAGAWQEITCDLVGPLTETDSGKNAILTVVDRYSRSVRAFAVRHDIDAEGVAELLRERIVAETGPLFSILTDRGSIFTARVMEQLWTHAGTDLRHTTAYNPRCDGLSERYNRSLVVGLRAAMAERGGANWDKLLPDVVWMLNSTPHESLGGCSPFYAAHCREPLQFVDAGNGERRLEVMRELAPLPKENGDDAQLQRGVDRMVREALERAKAKYKREADARLRPAPVFKAGDRVLVHQRALVSVMDRDVVEGSRKLAPIFVGPYRVVEYVRNSYRLDFPRTIRAHPVVNVRYLRAYPAEGTFGRVVEPPPLFVEGESVFFRPERVVKHRARRGALEYLVKFVGYENTHNRWLEVEDMRLCRGLVMDYWHGRKELVPEGALPADEKWD